MAKLRLTLLGGFEARTDSGLSSTISRKNAQMLLAYLAMHPKQTHLRDKLATLLWDDAPAEQARLSLRQTLFIIRQALPFDPTVVDGDAVAFAADAVTVDVSEFEHVARSHDPDELERAAALYQGDLLEGISPGSAQFEEWLRAERERLHELALEAFAKLLAHQMKLEATESAIQTALRLLSLDPLQEVTHRALMRLYTRQGRRAAALHQYQVCVDLLRRELGVEPEEGTRELYRTILPDRQPAPFSLEPVAPTRSRGRRIDGLRRRRRTPSLEAPLIGREAELSQLRQLLRAVRRRRGTVVALVGEAGVGKTRIAEQLSAIAGRRGGAILVGRAYESAQVLPFSPWVDALRRGLAAADRTARDGFSGIWRTELARLLPELGDPGPLAPAASEDYLRLFEAIAQLLRHLAFRQPVLLVLEDLHWADDMSIRLLPFLARRLENQAVLLLVTARAEEVEETPALRRALDELTAESRVTQLTLTALSQQQTEILVEALTPRGRQPSDLANVAKRVWALSEGNPFMIVETTRAIREGRIIETAGGLQLPERIREVILGQLARLSDFSRELVGVAALIGREFEFPVLQAAAGVSPREVARGIEELVRRRVLHGLEERLDFAHDRIREVASERILAPHRKLLHLGIARALEEVYAQNLEPHFEALGMHYWESEVWDKAALYERQAGAKAIARSAYVQAVASYERALEALRHLPESPEMTVQAIDLRLELCVALYSTAQNGRALAVLREAEASAATLGDQPRLARILSGICTGLRLAGEIDAATEVGRRALTIATGLGDVSLEVEARHRLGQVYTATGDYGQAAEFFTRNLDARRDPPTSLDQGSAAWFTIPLGDLGRFAEGLALGEEMVRHASESNRPYSLVRAFVCLGMLRTHKGDLRHSIALLERALDVSQTWSIVDWSADAMAHLGRAYQLAGRLDRALPVLEQAVVITETTGNKFAYPWYLAWLSEGYLEAGRLAQARERAQRAVDVSRKIKARGAEAQALHSLAASASHQDPLNAETAECHYREAMALATELGMRPLVAHCHLGLGKLYRRTGKREQAQEHLTTATTMYREMGMTYWVEQAEKEMGELS
jgi:DNA-binding SARP family transcriptional activator